MDITVVRESFKAAKTSSGDVEIEPLIKGYEEIAKGYDNMGTLFHFASSNIRSRIKALQTLIRENSTAYSSAISALDYEKAQGTTKKTKSGATPASKVLLAVNREINFFLLVLKRMRDITDTTKMAPIAREAYDEALAAHEALPIRTAARWAMKTLPIRLEFIKRCFKNESSEVHSLLGATIVALEGVYNVMEEAFRKHELIKEAKADAKKTKAEEAATN